MSNEKFNSEMPNKEMRTRYKKPTTTTNDIYNILFTNVYNKIETVCKLWNREEAFKLADDYINSFYPIYDIILSKWDEQKIQKLFSGQFRIFPLRCYLLPECNGIPYEEKINKLDDILEKVKSLRKKFNNNRMYLDMIKWRITKNKIIKEKDEKAKEKDEKKKKN